VDSLGFILSVGRQGGGKPGVIFEGEPQTMPYGTGVIVNDLHGNKIYLNEEPR